MELAMRESYRVPNEITPNPVDAIRKPYFRPILEELGDLRSMTLGGTPGRGDSGSYTTRNPHRTKSGSGGGRPGSGGVLHLP